MKPDHGTLSWKQIIKRPGLYHWYSTKSYNRGDMRTWKVRVFADAKPQWEENGVLKHSPESLLDDYSNTFALDAPAQDLRTLL